MSSRKPATGPNLEPLKDYIRAREFYRQGQKQESLEALCAAIGAEAPTPQLAEHLDKFLEDDTTLSDMALHLALVETRRS